MHSVFNPKAQKCFSGKNKMTLFFGQVSEYPTSYVTGPNGNVTTDTASKA